MAPNFIIDLRHPFTASPRLNFALGESQLEAILRQRNEIMKFWQTLGEYLLTTLVTGLFSSIFGKSEALVSRSAFSRPRSIVFSIIQPLNPVAGGDGLRQLIYTEAVKRAQQGEA